MREEQAQGTFLSASSSLDGFCHDRPRNHSISIVILFLTIAL